MAIGQQRSMPISQPTLNLRDHIFQFRGVHALSTAQFAQFWSYYDGFVSCTNESAQGDRRHLKCVWRSCPATYALYLLPQDQIVVLEARNEHHHSVMDAVRQLPVCTVVRYQVLNAILATNFGDTAEIMKILGCQKREDLIRSGLDQLHLSYVEGLRDMLHRPKRESEEPEFAAAKAKAKRQRLK